VRGSAGLEGSLMATLNPQNKRRQTTHSVQCRCPGHAMSSSFNSAPSFERAWRWMCRSLLLVKQQLQRCSGVVWVVTLRRARAKPCTEHGSETLCKETSHMLCSILAVGFSGNINAAKPEKQGGDILVTITGDDRHTVHLWAWMKATDKFCKVCVRNERWVQSMRYELAWLPG
jgi:hypothetical protein